MSHEKYPNDKKKTIRNSLFSIIWYCCWAICRCSLKQNRKYSPKKWYLMYLRSFNIVIYFWLENRSWNSTLAERTWITSGLFYLAYLVFLSVSISHRFNAAVYWCTVWDTWDAFTSGGTISQNVSDLLPRWGRTDGNSSRIRVAN